MVEASVPVAPAPVVLKIGVSELKNGEVVVWALTVSLPPMPPVMVLDMEDMVPVEPAPAPAVVVAPWPESVEVSESDPDPDPDPDAEPSVGQTLAGVLLVAMGDGVRTRAVRQGHLQDMLGVVIRAGLLGAVVNTVLVVHGVAQAGHVVGLASKLGSLGIHVGDAHLLSSHLGQQIDVRQRNQDMDSRRTPRWTWRQWPCWSRPAGP